MRIQLTWTDPITGRQQQPTLEPPIAIGKEFARMPAEINGRKVSRMLIKDSSIADYHLLIDWQYQGMILYDQSNGMSIQVNGEQVSTLKLGNDDIINIGICQIIINFDASSNWQCDRTIGFLFKRRCDRTDPTNCPHCENDIYEYNEYSYYQGYGSYEQNNWGNRYYQNRNNHSYNSETGNVDFTEADTASFESEQDRFETDMGAS